eukprot:4539991-Prymnesium_polylepis.1
MLAELAAKARGESVRARGTAWQLCSASPCACAACAVAAVCWRMVRYVVRPAGCSGGRSLGEADSRVRAARSQVADTKADGESTKHKVARREAEE